MIQIIFDSQLKTSKVAARSLFNDEIESDYEFEIAAINELRHSLFKDWFEVGNK